MDHRCSGGIRGRNYGAIDKNTMQMTVVLEDDDGNEFEVQFPIEFVVCGTCDGKGSHVDPNIDSNGITGDEWNEWDYDERERYMSGGYDVTCYECNGDRVVPEINEKKLTEEQKKFFQQYMDRIKGDYEYERMCEMERRMESGEW